MHFLKQTLFRDQKYTKIYFTFMIEIKILFIIL